MPPRYAYWTILIDNKPTAFRAHQQEDLLPTLAQLRRTNADVVLKWFARGRVWDSPEAEREAQRRPRPREDRGRDWRPGGLHKDPRDRFRKPTHKDRHRPSPVKPGASGRSAEQPRQPGRPPAQDRAGTRPWRPKKPAALAKPHDKPFGKPYGKPPQDRWPRRPARSFPRGDRRPRKHDDDKDKDK